LKLFGCVFVELRVFKVGGVVLAGGPRLFGPHCTPWADAPSTASMLLDTMSYRYIWMAAEARHFATTLRDMMLYMQYPTEGREHEADQASPRRGFQRRQDRWVEKRVREQQRRMQALRLRELECTTDPLIAAHEYNKQFSPIFRLPMDILLQIFRECQDRDNFALFCLAQVSRGFRVGTELLIPRGWNSDGKMLPPPMQAHQTLYRMRRDGLCNTCSAFAWRIPAEQIDCCGLNMCEFGTHKSSYHIHYMGYQIHHYQNSFSVPKNTEEDPEVGLSDKQSLLHSIY